MATKIHFENQDKLLRAKGIITLLEGKARTPEEAEQKERFTDYLAQAGIALKDKDEALVFIYEKLGGLVLTSEEKEKAVKRKAAIKKKKVVKDEDDEDGIDADDED